MSEHKKFRLWKSSSQERSFLSTRNPIRMEKENGQWNNGDNNSPMRNEKDQWNNGNNNKPMRNAFLIIY